MATEPTPSILESLAPLERRIKEAIFLSSTEAGGDISPEYIVKVFDIILQEYETISDREDEEIDPAELLASLQGEDDEEEEESIGFIVDPEEYELPEDYEEDEEEYELEDVPAHGSPRHFVVCSKCGHHD